MRTFCSLPVALSRAETFRMPFASMSNVSSICGTPRVAGQHAALDRGAHRDDLVRIHALVGILPEELLDDVLDLGGPGRAADQDDLVYLGLLQARVLERAIHRRNGPLDEVLRQLLELG